MSESSFCILIFPIDLIKLLNGSRDAPSGALGVGAWSRPQNGSPPKPRKGSKIAARTSRPAGSAPAIFAGVYAVMGSVLIFRLP